MFYVILDVQEKKGKKTAQQPTGQPNNLPSQSYPASSIQHQGFAWGNQNNWPLPGQQQQRTAQKTNPNKGLLSPPPALSAIQNNFCEQTFSKYLNSSIIILEKLSQGVEHPELLYQMYNDTLAHNGHDIVKLPISVLQASRQMFTNKNFNNVYQPNFTPNHNFHSTGILQQQNAQLSNTHSQDSTQTQRPRARTSDFF